MSYIVFAKAEATGRDYRCSPDIESAAEAAFYLEEIREMWPQAYLVSFPGPAVTDGAITRSREN